MNRESMNAQEFVNGIEFPVFWYSGVGAPSGVSVAILNESRLPVDLDEVEGSVSAGVFEAANINDGSGIRGWKFSDERGNAIYKIQIFSNERIWNEQSGE